MPHPVGTGGPTAPGTSVWWNVKASSEDSHSGKGWTELSSNGNGAGVAGRAQSPNCLGNSIGACDFATLGKAYPHGTMLHILNPANGKSGTFPLTDVGNGSSFGPAIGLTPTVQSAIGWSGGDVHIQLADGSSLSVVPGFGTQVGGPFISSTGLTAGGTAGAGGTGTLTNDIFGSGFLGQGFRVGDPTNPDEDYWTAMNRIAQERYWLLFSDGETLYLADGPDLIAQTPSLQLDRIGDAAAINHLEFTYDNTAFNYVATHHKRNRTQRRAALAKVTSPVEAQLFVVSEIDEVRAGDVTELSSTGPGDGRWLVGNCRRSAFDVFSEVNLVVALTPLTEKQLSTGVTNPFNLAGINPQNKGTTPVGSLGGASTGTAHRGGGAYAALVDSNLVFAGVDQGIDFTSGPGNVYALADGVVTRAVPSGSGWPGSPGGLLVYRMTTGSHAGRYVYTAEDFDIASGMTVGATVQRGQAIGVANGKGVAPGIETGWADPDGTASAHAPSSGPTSFGRDFNAYVLAGGG